MNIYGYKLKIKKTREQFKKGKIGPRECVRRIKRYNHNIKKLRKNEVKKKI